MSFTWVTPCSIAYWPARARYSSNWSWVGSGIALLIIGMASSLNTPVGSPSLFFIMIPPAGTEDIPLIFANDSAFELANAICPSYRWTKSGWSPVTESIHSFCGSSPPQFSWSQSPPWIQASPGCAIQYAFMVLMKSCFVLASFNWTLANPYPPNKKWVWLSMKPGTIIFPCKSITSAEEVSSVPISFPT